MSVWKQTTWLLQKEFTLEWRKKYAFFSILLYLLLIVFTVMLAVNIMEGQTWNALFWIILLFQSIQAVTKSFAQESTYRHLYYYSLVHPSAVVLSKMIYNALLLMVTGVIAWLCYSAALGDPIWHHFLFLVAVLLGALGFSFTFTLMAAIAWRAENNISLMTILSLPVFIPLLLLLIHLSKYAFVPMAIEQWLVDCLLVMFINVMIAGLSVLLFPYLWRD